MYEIKQFYLKTFEITLIIYCSFTLVVELRYFFVTNATEVGQLIVNKIKHLYYLLKQKNTIITNKVRRPSYYEARIPQ